MEPFALFRAVVGASGTAQKALEYLRGGPMTQVLDQMGDVHLASASDHLRQAGRSPNARDRLSQAAGDLQNAYVLFSRTAGAGPSRILRLVTDMDSVTRARGLAAGCAASIALIQWVQDDAVENRQDWLDRAGRQVALHLKEFEDRFGAVGLFKSDFTLEWDQLKRSTTYFFEQYRELEANCLPKKLARATDFPADPVIARKFGNRGAEFVLARSFFDAELERPAKDLR